MPNPRQANSTYEAYSQRIAGLYDRFDPFENVVTQFPTETWKH